MSSGLFMLIADREKTQQVRIGMQINITQIKMYAQRLP